jgi:hypothetical protein
MVPIVGCAAYFMGRFAKEFLDVIERKEFQNALFDEIGKKRECDIRDVNGKCRVCSAHEQQLIVVLPCMHTCTRCIKFWGERIESAKRMYPYASCNRSFL